MPASPAMPEKLPSSDGPRHPNVVSMVDQRRRRWFSIETTLGWRVTVSDRGVSVRDFREKLSIWRMCLFAGNDPIGGEVNATLSVV